MLIEKIKGLYAQHESFNEMIEDLSGGAYYDHWAQQVLHESFGKNEALSRELFQKAVELADGVSEIRTIAENIANEDSLNDRTWAKELFQKAIEEVDGDTYDIQSIAESVANEGGLNDKKWATEIYHKAIDMADSGFEYINIANSMVENCISNNNKDLLKELYQKGLDLSETTEEIIASVEGIVSDDGLSDIKWAEELHHKAMGLAESHDEYMSIADSMIDNNILINDKEMLKELYQKAFDAAEEAEDYCEYEVLAIKVSSDSYGDIEWAKSIYSKALELCDDEEDRQILIEGIQENIGDTNWIEGFNENDGHVDVEEAESDCSSTLIAQIKELYAQHESFDEMIEDLSGDNCYDYWAQQVLNESFGKNVALSRELYQKAIDKSTDANELLSIAESIADYDKKWAEELYHKAIEMADSSYEYADIANSMVANCMLNNDKGLLKTLYQKTIETSEDAYELISIAESIASNDGLSDMKWAEELYHKAMGLSEQHDHYMSIADSMIENNILTSDKAMLKTLYQKAYDASEEEEDYCEYQRLGAAVASESYGDLEWAKLIYSKALELCDDDEDKQNMIEEIQENIGDADWVDGSNAEENDTHGEKEDTVRIYIKAEPAGRLFSGKLNDDCLKELIECSKAKQDYNALNIMDCPFEYATSEYFSVFIEEDKIDIEVNQKTIQVKPDMQNAVSNHNHAGDFKAGYYFLLTELSKVSTEVNFETTSFNTDLLKISADTVDFREFGEVYGGSDAFFKVITDITYNDESFELDYCDRGFDQEFIVIKIDKDGDASADASEVLRIKNGEVELDKLAQSELRSEVEGNQQTCHQCKSANKSDAKFCGECGEKLTLECQQCRAEYQMGDKFCSGCGSSLIIKEEEAVSADDGPYLTIELLSQSLSCIDRCYLSPNIPLKKFNKASGAYLGNSNYDDVLLLIDNTVMGSAKEGLTITKTSIYEKKMLQEGTSHELDSITSVSSKKTKIYINGELLTDLHMLNKNDVERLCNCLATGLNL